MAIAKFSSQLKKDHQLFQILAGSNAPTWWKNMKDRHDLYIDIRKGNYINVYYYGASIAKIEMKRGQKQPSAQTHPKYLGHNDRMDSRYYRKGIDKKRNRTVYYPIYQDCGNELEHHLDEMLVRAYNVYVNRNNKENISPENVSEKKIQGQIITHSKPMYIDSEFAHRYEEGSQKTIRIDLVRIKNGKIQFVELKRIQDNRMLHIDGEPEILTQIHDYRTFLSANKELLKDYYKKLLKIKQDLKLPVPTVDIENLDIDTTPVLLIADYQSDNERRIHRRKEIERILNAKDVVIEYADNYS